ncbi:uncharacterized protein N7515_000202 [Penicillium bovifimosum]|uniref:CCHC-type domain-containing protein n=1 Tax=Penicillium bovifimosum TaxID=126998 RepID=A0A9W9HEZ2_9EURO|nr:uncharacterized protein N7515_003962 [Penicillium bovifimosum]XP_056526112.1 uncharacterized protein N7515_000202 [Penicillium bovifimosum]KAJ5139114.1 hypothetical protein N7515_003962 [Penicillium bovifimosum]KAJ5145638.1 hypothetical protein N7515_000202 [Penicillium bovifimosum]
MAPPKADKHSRQQRVSNPDDEPQTPPNPDSGPSHETAPDPLADNDDDTGGGFAPQITFKGTRLINLQLDSPTVTKQLLKIDLKDRYDKLTAVYKELEQKFYELERLNSELQDKPRNQEGKIIRERDEAMARYQRAREERNNARADLEKAVSRAAAATEEKDAAITKLHEMAIKFCDLQTRAPIVEAVKKTTRLPDAPMLSDGVDIRYESWMTGIKRKLTGNADHFPDANARIQYVQSRAEGQAFRHMAPRLNEESPDPYKDYGDILAHMKTVFSNPNHAAEARAKYQRLTMKPRDQFTSFLADFMELANEANIHVDNRKVDLYEKLPPLLQSQMLGDSCEDEVSFETFKDRCIRRSHAIALAQQSKTTTATGRGRSNPVSSSTGVGSSSSNTKVKTENPTSSTYVPMSATERATLMKEGRCFGCKEHGHMTRDCPKNTSKPTAAPTVATTQPVVNLTALEDPAVDNSGKARA